MLEKEDLVWVPKQALALWSNPEDNLFETRDLWNIGIIIDKDDTGNLKVLVNGQMEYTHTNFVKKMVRKFSLSQ